MSSRTSPNVVRMRSLPTSCKLKGSYALLTGDLKTGADLSRGAAVPSRHRRDSCPSDEDFFDLGPDRFDRPRGEMMLRGDMEPLAQKKAQNFLEFQALYPEFDFIFVGDNGQGDARAAELMAAASSPRGGRLERAYIHIVQPIDRTHRGRHHSDPESAREAWDKAGVVFVETFVDAALDACSRKFISPLGLRRVGVAAKKDFEVIQWVSRRPPEGHAAPGARRRLRRLNRALVVDYGWMRCRSARPVPHSQ